MRNQACAAHHVRQIQIACPVNDALKTCANQSQPAHPAATEPFKSIEAKNAITLPQTDHKETTAPLPVRLLHADPKENVLAVPNAALTANAIPYAIRIQRVHLRSYVTWPKKHANPQ